VDKSPKHKHRVKDRHAKDHQRQQTSIQEKTLNPVWNECTAELTTWRCKELIIRCPNPHKTHYVSFPQAFEFELENPNTAILAVDLWDHDDEASVSGTLKGITKVCNVWWHVGGGSTSLLFHSGVNFSLLIRTADPQYWERHAWLERKLSAADATRG
jgi:hypothetical protein